jgi:hypothetical protein
VELVGVGMLHKIAVPIVAVPIVAVALAGCINTKAAHQHYDNCANQYSSFLAMAECGKRQVAACEKTPWQKCSSEGEMLMLYADALVTSVKNREISEPQAMQRWLEFRTKVSRQRQEASDATAAATTAAAATATTATTAAQSHRLVGVCFRPLAESRQVRCFP